MTYLTPWPHQAEGTTHIVERDATALWFDMGTGKTKTVIDAIDQLWPKGQCYNRNVLIVAPKSVVSVWPGEFAKHAQREVAVLPLTKGPICARTRELNSFLVKHRNVQIPNIVVINYEAVWRTTMGELIRNINWAMIVCDESHRIKSPKRNARASRFIGELGKRARKRVCLSGTPLAHSPLDAFAQYRFLDPSIFGRSFIRFKNRYAIIGGFAVNGRPVQVVGYQNQDELREKMFSIALQVKKQDVLDLPPVMHEKRIVELEPKARRAYEQLEDTLIADVEEGIVTASNAMVRFLRLQQITSGHVQTEEGKLVEISTAKKEALSDLICDLPRNERLVVFCRFTADIQNVATVTTNVHGESCCELSGQRNDLAQWQAGGDASPILAVQIQAGGGGVDLSMARYCCYYSMGFSLSDYEQSLARVHRPGQTRNVTYYHLIARKSVDGHVYKALAKKADVIETILQAYQNKEQDYESSKLHTKVI